MQLWLHFESLSNHKQITAEAAVILLLPPATRGRPERFGFSIGGLSGHLLVHPLNGMELTEPAALAADTRVQTER